MKLAAQRVMQPGTRRVAIHAFYYSHGSYVWEGAAPESVGNGTLEASQVDLRPLGTNQVLSYLDIIAPDEVPNSRIIEAFARIYDGERAPPFKATVGNCTFVSNMIRPYQLGWRQELVKLFEAALSIRVSVRSASA